MDSAFLAIPLASFFVGLLACRTARAWALRSGYVDHPGERKIHDRAIPYGGGIALVVATLAPVAAGAWAAAAGDFPYLPESLRAHLPGMRDKLPDLALLLAGGLVMFGLGYVDDRRRLTPATKFLVQIAVATTLAAGGVRFSLFLETSTWGVCLSGTLTVLWIVGITNAMNFLDNMDGLCAGVSTLAATIFLVIALQTGQLFIAFLLLALIGGGLAFLCFNFPPASMFLGDAGSLFLGYLLSTLTVLFTFYEYREEPALLAFCVPLFVLAVPVHDTITVVWIRLRAGDPIWKGDNRHLSHRLVQLGFSRRGAVLFIYLLTLCTGLAGTLVYHTSLTGALTALLQVVLVLLALTLLESVGRRAADSRNREGNHG